MRRESAKAGARPAAEKGPPRACSDARRRSCGRCGQGTGGVQTGRGIVCAAQGAECADVAKAISENGKRCSAQAERGKRAGARREWFWYGITSPLMRLQSRKASLIAAFADTCGGAHKGGAGQRRSFGGKPCLRFGAVRFLQGRGTFDFCGGGAFDFLPPSADGSEGLPRRVRRRWLLAAQRRGWCGALMLLLLLLLCSPDACGAGLRQCGGGGDGQRLLVIRRSERRFLQRLCLFYYAP